MRERVHSDSGRRRPARGVIHPSFPLRGRWGRRASGGEQAPSPSLASLAKRHLECTLTPHIANYAPVLRTPAVRARNLFSVTYERSLVETHTTRFQKGPLQPEGLPASGITLTPAAI